jgi:hypothetical protein
VGLSVVLELLCLILPATANGPFPSLIADSNVVYKVPIPRRAVWFGRVFVPGAFHTGMASKLIAFFAVDFLSIGFVSVQYMIHPSKYSIIIILTITASCNIPQWRRCSHT